MEPQALTIMVEQTERGTFVWECSCGVKTGTWWGMDLGPCMTGARVHLWSKHRNQIQRRVG